MSDLLERRAAQKARTRARILETAQRMFAEQGFEPVTIVAIAGEAGVSVQTVFNHFAGKEELFFADRALWVEGPAAAVRGRRPQEPPKPALRRHLVDSVERYARSAGDPHHERMIEVLESSTALRSYERRLHDEAVALLADALAEAWGCGGAADDPCRTLLAEVTASVWMAAVRTVVMDIRKSPPAPGDENAVAHVVALIEDVLGDLDTGLNFAAVDVPAARVG